MLKHVLKGSFMFYIERSYTCQEDAVLREFHISIAAVMKALLALFQYPYFIGFI